MLLGEMRREPWTDKMERSPSGALMKKGQRRAECKVITGDKVMSNDNLIWIDLEMTGLEPETDVILEIATIVTDGDLNVIAEGPCLAVNHAPSVIDGMDEWNTTHHTESGLVDRVLNSDHDTRSAELATLHFLRQHVDAKASPMCGNSIGQDRRFLVKYMPELEDFFHYRNLDVSTVKELARRWRPDVLDAYVKKNMHQALEDTRESIRELQIYRDLFFKMKP